MTTTIKFGNQELPVTDVKIAIDRASGDDYGVASLTGKGGGVFNLLTDRLRPSAAQELVVKSLAGSAREQHLYMPIRSRPTFAPIMIKPKQLKAYRSKSGSYKIREIRRRWRFARWNVYDKLAVSFKAGNVVFDEANSLPDDFWTEFLK